MAKKETTELVSALPPQEKTIQEYIVAQLEQPVLVNQKDPETGQVKQTYATDPRDGHQLTTTEAIAMKIMQNALNGDLKAAEWVMRQQMMHQAQHRR